MLADLLSSKSTLYTVLRGRPRTPCLTAAPPSGRRTYLRVGVLLIILEKTKKRLTRKLWE